eukprot:XP_020407979.1 uncharacterized protein LOC103656047 [Zea mays]
MVLIDIRNMLQSMGKDIQTFPLPPIIDAYDDAIGTAREVYEEESIELASTDMALKDSLNEEQWVAYDKIMSVVNTNQGGLFFVDGPGGTGKTYLYRVLLATLRGGTEVTNSDGDIRLPDEVCVPYSGSDNDLDNLIDFVFPNLNENMSDSTYITSRAILSTRNNWVDMINTKMIDRFQGEHMVYHSFDSAMDDPHNYYPPEFLNTLTPNGLPPHVLKLKIGCPVILLRNIDPANGLCNGTRLVVRGFQRNSIDAEIVLGQYAGKRIFLPRIPLCPSDDEIFPFQFKRKQFPIRLSFAMTVNKAQGQTIPNVGVYLPEPVFSHGQLYVALSRATARSNIKILAIPAINGKKRSRKGVRKNPTVDGGTYTKNIVYKEVLTN